jgi:hypothetical protein
MSYNREQKGVEIGTSKEGGLVPIDDHRLPTKQIRWYAPDYNKHSWTYFKPYNAQSSFKASAQEIIKFNIKASEDIAIDWSQSYFEFGVNILKAGVAMTEAECDTYSTASVLTTVAQANAGDWKATTNLKCIYTRASECLFNSFAVKSSDNQTLLDEIKEPALKTMVELLGQDNSYWEQDSSQLADVYMNTQHKFINGYDLKVAADVSTITPLNYIPEYDQNAPAAGFPCFDKCRKVLKMMNHGFRFRMRCPSDLLQSNVLHLPYYSGLQLEMMLNPYARAMTEFNITSASAGNTTTWTHGATNFDDFQITDLRLVVKKYKMTESIYKSIALSYATTGFATPFSKMYYDSFSVNPGVYLTSWTFNHPEVRSLTKLIFIFQGEKESIVQDVKLAHWEFSMSQSMGIASAVPYDGLSKISIRYNGDYLNNDIENMMEVGRYKTEFYKQQAIECFSNPENTNFTKTLYDGVDTKTGLFNNLNSSFFVGIPFQSVQGSERSGIDCSKSLVFCEFSFGAHVSSGLIRCHCLAICDAEIEYKQGSSPAVKT